METFYVTTLSWKEVADGGLRKLMNCWHQVYAREAQEHMASATGGARLQKVPMKVYTGTAEEAKDWAERFGNHDYYILMNAAAKSAVEESGEALNVLGELNENEIPEGFSVLIELSRYLQPLESGA
ncbi:MAG: hypothetical protein AB1426_08575 [Bacillota bacterium]